MAEEISQVAIQIVRFVLEHQPSIVAGELVDANAERHAFIEKCAMFVDEWLWADSAYPIAALMRCLVLERWVDEQGQALVRITTDKPDSIESDLGRTEFVVFAHQVTALTY